MSPVQIDESDDQALMTQLNTTPLIDVLLVLLVMLIISIPAARHAVNLALPQATVSEVKPQTMLLELLPDRGLRWNGQPLADAAALEAQLQQAAQLSPRPIVHIRPHRQVPYESVAHALSSAQRQGLEQVALLDGFE